MKLVYGDLCLAADVPDIPFTDPSPAPVPGNGRFLLVRGDNVCGRGRYETSSDGGDRLTTVCP